MNLDELIRAHLADLTELTKLASNDLRVAWRDLPTEPIALRNALRDLLPQLGELYGSAAATLGADWYDELRDALGVGGRFVGIASELPDDGRYEALAGWAVGPVFSGDPDPGSALTLATGGLQRIVANADRYSVMRSSVADPKAHGWQRKANGGCNFCVLLAGRGNVYTKESVRFGGHDHCSCTAVPAFGGREVAVKPYTPTDRNISDADRARVREYISRNL